MPNIGTVPLTQGWNSVNWNTVPRKVRQVQTRIVKYLKQGKFWKAKKLQRLLRNSFIGALIAVRRVTSNKGKKTAGVDGKLLDTPAKKWDAAINIPKSERYKPLPLKRIQIPKKNGKKRPLGIPTQTDRVVQAIHLQALEPVSEFSSDGNSYGFRPCRSTSDAIESCFQQLSRKNSPEWILEADIKGCFDNISHEWLIRNIPTDKVVLSKWLKSGFVLDNKLYPTMAGTPQGGIISPALANMVLDGLEALLKKKFKGLKINFTRYADDFIVTGSTKELLENEVIPVITEFLKERGLELSPDKTRITHIDDGFDFLGFNIRKYKGKLLIKPSKESVKSVTKEIKEIIDSNKQAKQENLIWLLNPVIRGWANYNCHVVSSKIFRSLDHKTWETLWQWAKRRHPKKGLKWIKNRYFKSQGKRNWVFSTGDKTLINMSDTLIRRHVKIRMDANPYDREQEPYFERRWEQSWKKEPSQKRKRLLTVQHGLCPICRQRLHPNDELNIHHRIPKVQGGNDTLGNLMLVHGVCHRQLHANKQEE
jgi:RNA-directed DNA polymerase